MDRIAKTVALFAALVFVPALYAQEGEKKEGIAPIYRFNVLTIDEEEVSLSTYKGKVLLIVNVASKCGYTPQYKGLQELHRNYMEKGLVVLGFPANDFGAQEPGTNAEIKAFCSTKYGVDFPMFAKISVKGQNMHPLYKFLTDKATNPDFAGEITWNFNKFLVDRNGKVVARFSSKDKPEDEKVIKT